MPHENRCLVDEVNVDSGYCFGFGGKRPAKRTVVRVIAVELPLTFLHRHNAATRARHTAIPLLVRYLLASFFDVFEKFVSSIDVIIVLHTHAMSSSCILTLCPPTERL